MTQWHWPIAGGQPGRVTNPYGAPQTITAGYGANFGNKPKNARGQPINTGVDIPGQAGQAVLNLDDGIVEEVRRYSPQEEAAGRDSTGGYGNSIVVRLRTGQRVRYSHMQQPPPFAVGQAVQGGAQLGTVGDTGNATGPHLDLEMQDQGGQYIDPMVTGGWTTGGPTAPLPAGPMQPGGSSGRPGLNIVEEAWELPAGMRIGQAFRRGQQVAQQAGQAAGRIVGYAQGLPNGAALGQAVRDPALVAAWRQEMADGPAYPKGGPQSAYPDSESAYPPDQSAYPPEGSAAPPSGAANPPPAGSTTRPMGQGGPTPGASAGPITPQSSPQEVEAEIRRVAQAKGHPELADLLVAVGMRESGLRPYGPPGDGGKSWGVFQEHDGGPGGKLPPAERQNVTTQTARRIDEFVAIMAQPQNKDLLKNNPGQLAVLAQRPAEGIRGDYIVDVNTKLAQLQGRQPGEGAVTGLGRTPRDVAPDADATSPRLAGLKADREAANRRLTQAQAEVGMVRDWAGRNDNPPLTDFPEGDRAARAEHIAAVKNAKLMLPRIEAEIAKAEADVTRLDQAIDSEVVRLNTKTQTDQAKVDKLEEWSLKEVNGKYVWTNAKGETKPYEGPGSKPTAKPVTGVGNAPYILIDNGDGTFKWEENKGRVPEKPTQLSGEGEFFTLIGENGQVRQVPNQAYNALDKISDNGRTLFFDKRTGQYVGELDTKTPEERKAATDKGKAETDKAVAEAESLRVKAAADKKEAEEWARIEEAIKAGATPAEVNTLVLQAAKSVQDYTNLLKAEQEKHTFLETQRSNLAKEEVATRAQRVSEGDSALKGAESYSRYGLASAPYQTALLASQAPVTDVRKLAGSMNIDPDVTNPVAERYDRQMQAQEEMQASRRKAEEEQRQPFFAPYQAKQPGAQTQAQPQAQPGAPEQAQPDAAGKEVDPERQAVDLRAAGKPGYARTYYKDGSHVDWPINAPAGAPEPQAQSAPPQESPQPEPQSATAGGADYGAAGASAQEAPAAEGYMGMPGFQDASFKYGRDEGPGVEPIPNVPTPPGGFWDGVSPPTPEQLEYINSQRVYLSGGGGFVGGGGGLPPTYVPLMAGGGGGGGGGGAGGGARRPRRPVAGKHAVPLDGDWWRTEYDDGAREDWHIDDGPSWDGVGGRGSGFHGEHPPTYGIGWDEGTGGGGGSIWTLPPTPGAVPGMMGTPPMNPGGAVGGMGNTPPSPPPGGGMAGGFAGPAATGGGADPNAPPAPAAPGGDPMAAMAGAMGAAGGAPPGGAAPQIPQDPLTYGGGAPYGGGGAGGGMPGMFSQAPAGSPTAPQGQAMAPMWDAASPAPFVTNGVAGPAGASGQKTLYQGGASGLPAIGGGSARGRPPSSSGSYYGGPPAPQAISPLQRLLQQSGVTPLSAGGAAGMPATI